MELQNQRKSICTYKSFKLQKGARLKVVNSWIFRFPTDPTATRDNYTPISRKIFLTVSTLFKSALKDSNWYYGHSICIKRSCFVIRYNYSLWLQATFQLWSHSDQHGGWSRGKYAVWANWRKLRKENWYGYSWKSSHRTQRNVVNRKALPLYGAVKNS